MIRIIDFRLVIEKVITHNKYYPKVVSFSTVAEYPVTNPPSATITIMSASNLNDVSTVSQVEFDDIVRLQASIKYSDNERDVWVDIFEGRVENQSKAWGTNNEITLSCKGHIQEAFKKNIPVNLTWSNKDATVILQAMGVYLDRITYNSSYAVSGLTVAEYNLQIDQNMVVDAFKEMEKLSGYKRMIEVVPVYNASGDLQTCYLRWRPLPTISTKQYAIIEGTPRLISSNFDVIGEDVANYFHMLGGTDPSGNQYAGSIGDDESIAKYGRRDQVDTNTWIGSNSLCLQIAAGLLQDSKLPYVAGSVVLEGTLDAHIGDLVTVYNPSLEVKGVQIDGTYTSYRVVQAYSGGQFTTTLDVGGIKKKAEDYISKNLTQIVRTAYKNQAK